MNIVYFMGGFANQLFQLCMYEKLKEEYGKENVVADISFYKKCRDHGGFKLDKFIKLKYIYDTPVDCISLNESNYDDIEHKEDEVYLYCAYWQSESFFPHNMTFIDNIISVRNLNSRNRKLYDVISDSQSVSIHVRRGDYVDHFLHGNIANEQYIRNAIDYIKTRIDNPVFFVFSDDLEWCKKNLSIDGSKCYYVSGNDKSVEQDLILMSSCKHNIIANSSYSWWAQELNKNENKIVISPEYWFNDIDIYNGLNKNSFIHVRNVPNYQESCENPFFSILISVFNGENSIKRCLASVLNQTFKNIEIIVVDDGSTDHTYDILTQYAKYDARICVIKNELNSSQFSSRLRAMKRARGKYILLLDSDDYYCIDACMVLYEMLKDNQTDILEFAYVCEPSKKVIVDNTVYDDTFFEKLIKWEAPHTIWNKCYHFSLIKKVVETTKEFYCNMSEDALFASMFYTFAKTYRRIDNILYHYITEGGISNKKTIEKEALVKILKSIQAYRVELEGFLQKYNPQGLSGIREGKLRELRYITDRIMHLEQSVVERVELLRMVDECFDTRYAEAFDKRLNEGWIKYEDYIFGRKKHKIKLLLKSIVKEVKDYIS